MRLQPGHPLGSAAIALMLLAVCLGPPRSASAQSTSGPVAATPTAAPEDAEVLTRGARAQLLVDQQAAFGSYYDPTTREHVLVVAAGEQPPSSERISRAVGGPLRIKRLPISRLVADSLRKRVLDRDFHPDAKKYTYATYPDLRTGKVVVYTDAPEHVTDVVSAEYLDAIDLRYGPVALDKNRHLDTEKFYGGASITDVSNNIVCSSGFTIHNGVSSITGEGHRYQVTAGHCFPQGAGVLTSGALPFGYVIMGANWGQPNFRDVETLRLIVTPLNKTGATYNNRIWVGGTVSTTSKPVYGGNNPVVGYPNYCRSGQTTGEQCIQTVVSLDAAFVDAFGQLHQRMIAYQGPNPSAGGDSGAPFYAYSVDATGVHIRGMHTAIIPGGTAPMMFAVRFWDIMARVSGTLLCAGANYSCWVQPD